MSLQVVSLLILLWRNLDYINKSLFKFGGTYLFKNVNLKFLPDNCYGSSAQTAPGKSTFLKILAGDLEPSTGEVLIAKNMRMSVLKQDHYAFDEFTVLDTVIQGIPGSMKSPNKRKHLC